jgi:hypothetical protein
MTLHPYTRLQVRVLSDCAVICIKLGILRFYWVSTGITSLEQWHTQDNILS